MSGATTNVQVVNAELARPSAWPLGGRGEHPVFFRTTPNDPRAYGLRQVPGIVRVPGGVATTWDAAFIAARVLGVPAPVVPIDTPLTRALCPGLDEYRSLGLHEKLRPYQKDDVAFLARRAFAFNCEPPRTGKTAVALAASILTGARHVLVVCPAIAKWVWAAEALKWLGLPVVVLDGRAPDEARIICKTCCGSGRDLEGRRCPGCRAANGSTYGYHLYRGADAALEAIRSTRFTVINYDCLIAHAVKDTAGKRSLREDLPGWCPTLAQVQFDVVIADECFVAGTKVGEHGIETLQPGDFVPSYDESTGSYVRRRVRAVSRQRPQALVRLHLHDGRSIISTPNHPFLTTRGWRPAAALTSQHVLCYYYEDAAKTRLPRRLRELREAHRNYTEEGVGYFVHAASARVHPAELLLAGMRDEMQGGTYTSRLASTSSDARRTHACQEPDARPGNTRQATCDTSSHGLAPLHTRWERQADPCATTDVGGRARLASRGRSEHATTARSQVSTIIQDRHRESKADDRDRSGWRFAQQPIAPREGSQEGDMPAWARVDRVEILEPGSDGRFGGLCRDGYVYNLEVEGTHTYLAEGLVVHNCHLLRGRTYDRERIGESRRERFAQLVRSTSRVWGLTGTPIFAFTADLWGQLDAITGGLWGRKRWNFDVSYCAAFKGEYAWENKGRSNVPELRHRLATMLVKKSRAVLLPYLPKKTRQVQRIDAPRELKALTPKKNAGDTYAAAARAAATVKRPIIIGALIEELAASTMTEPVKLLVYCYMRETATAMAQDLAAAIRSARKAPARLREMNTTVWCVTGATNAKGRFDQAAAFCASKTPGVFVATIDAVQVAISLKGAIAVHFADLHHDPSAMLQAEDRPNEEGVGGLAVVCWVLNGSVDEHTIAVVLPKVETLEAVMSEPDAVSMKAALARPEETLSAIVARLTAHVGDAA